MRLKFIFLFIAILLQTQNVYARSVYCVNCSDKWQQAIEKATSIDQLATLHTTLNESLMQTQQQITMVTQNIEQFENMIKNTVNLPIDIYEDVQAEYSRLQNLYKEMGVLSGNLDGLQEAYDVRYPKFGEISKNYTENWTAWSDQMDSSNQALLKVTGVQLSDLTNDDSNVQGAVNNLLSAPEGRMEAIQAGNQLSAMQMQEMRELRTLMAAGLQQQAVESAKQEKINQAAMEQDLRVMPGKRKLSLENIGNGLMN